MKNTRDIPICGKKDPANELTDSSALQIASTSQDIHFEAILRMVQEEQLA